MGPRACRRNGALARVSSARPGRPPPAAHLARPHHPHRIAIAVPTRPASLPFEIRKSSIQGRGAFAKRQIRKGQRLIEYTGDRITPEEGDRRYVEDGMRRHHTFLFTVDAKTCIDGKRGGNESRYINHSCDPNCEAVIEDGRIFLFAKKAMAPGTELTYDYQYERTPEHTKEDEEFYRCLCGSPKCRGTILAPPKRKRAAKQAAKGTKATKSSKSTKATKVTKGTKAGAKKQTGVRKTGATTGSASKRGAAKTGARKVGARA